MPSSAALRQQIETAFQHRYPSVLTPYPKTIREVVPTGIAQIDTLLNGGIPVGAITEITGPATSGRTSIAISALAQRTREGSVCAWIDARDSLDPESAAASGVSLHHLLWVRCSDKVAPRPDRSQGKNASDSQPRDSQPRDSKPWTRLDQALRATDLLLQSGGFASIVLDLADESIEHARRIPLATWFRYRQAADRTRCSLLVLGKAPFAQSSAAVVLECSPAAVASVSGTVIRNFSYKLHRQRERFSHITSIDRKPPASTWTAQAAWDAEKRA
jgi:recA bacterial DNA recombination protein